jgi:hypothetical protein
LDGDNNEHADNVIYLALQKQVSDGYLYGDSDGSETINAIEECPNQSKY